MYTAYCSFCGAKLRFGSQSARRYVPCPACHRAYERAAIVFRDPPSREGEPSAAEAGCDALAERAQDLIERSLAEATSVMEHGDYEHAANALRKAAQACEAVDYVGKRLYGLDRPLDS